MGGTRYPWQWNGYHSPTTPRTAATPLIPNIDDCVSQNLTAGLLLAALPHLARLGLPAPTAATVLEVTGAGRSRAYEIRAALNDLLPTLLRPPGRPAAQPAPAADTGDLSRALLDYVFAHPGAVTTRGSRREYSPGFRAEVLGLAAAHDTLDRQQLADAVRIPKGTLEDWLMAPVPPPEPVAAPQADDDPIGTARTASLIAAWRGWSGGFATFCDHVRTHLDIPWGNTRIGTVLSVHADRRARRRPGRRPDEKALRSAFLTFFPGAQWAEDGSPITIDWNGERFTFNWELVVDTASAACVGADVRVTETSDAVVAAYKDAVGTTGAPPLALNTDNATENDGPGVTEALGSTAHIHTTLGRPQGDCHVEGTFGLFQQTAPPLVIVGDTPRKAAHAVLVLLLTVFMRTLNHRPRPGRSGNSRVQLYREACPTPEQIARAKAALAEIQTRQDRAERTRQARANPAARALLDAAFQARGWLDPERRVRDAIAGYPIDDVIAGVAIVEGKAKAGRLPPDVPPRYLLSIVRNIADEREGHAVAEALWRRRLEVRDHALTRLVAERDAVHGGTRERLHAFTDRALTATSNLQRIVWQDAIAAVIGATPQPEQKPLFDGVVRRVHSDYRITARDRADIVRDIAERIVHVA